MKRLTFVMAIALVLPLPVSATETSPDGVASVFVRGEIIDNVMMTSLRPSQGVTKAVRVYTEPSHTLVAAVVNDSGVSPMGDQWYETTFAALTATQRDIPVIRVPFRNDETFVISTFAPPVDDGRLNVVLNGAWDDGDGIVTEREVSFFMTTRIGKFAFTYTRVLGYPIDETIGSAETTGSSERPRRVRQAPRRLQPFAEICCGEGQVLGCRKVCAQCSGENYSCCNETVDPSGCGFCGQIVAYCRTQLCPQC